jgi:hypothetical protein
MYKIFKQESENRCGMYKPLSPYEICSFETKRTAENYIKSLFKDETRKAETYPSYTLVFPNGLEISYVPNDMQFPTHVTKLVYNKKQNRYTRSVLFVTFAELCKQSF